MRRGRSIVVFVLTCALSGCGGREEALKKQETDRANVTAQRQMEDARATAIEQVLTQDARAGHLSDPRLTLNGMRAIDLSNVPGDFRQSYQAHIRAWADAARAQEAFDNLARRDAAGEARGRPILAEILGRDPPPRLQDAIELAQTRLSEANDRVSATARAMEGIALSYHASVSRAQYESYLNEM